MPGVIPISQIDKAVKESVARTINGLVALKKLGLHVQMPKEIQIQMSVCRDEGINAIPRIKTSSETNRKSVSKDGGSTRVSKKDGFITKSSTTKGPEVSEETQTQLTESKEESLNSMGRSTETKIYYEQQA